MKIIEFAGANVRENLTCIKASLIKAVNDGDDAVTVFSSLCFVKENFDWMKQELKTKTQGLCKVKSSRPKNFCGYKMYGLEISFQSDDKDLLKSRILDLFQCCPPSYELDNVQTKRDKPC